MRIVHPRKDYNDPALSPVERAYRIRRYRARLSQWFSDMDAARNRTEPRSQREWRFCSAFAAGVVYLMGAAKRFTKKELTALAAAALDDAGYRKPSLGKGAELLELPRVQAGVAAALAAKGVTVDAAGEVLARIMSDTSDNANALAATELFFKVTTGFAVQKSANLHKHERSDRFFDEPKFANPGKPVVSTSQET